MRQTLVSGPAAETALRAAFPAHSARADQERPAADERRHWLGVMPYRALNLRVK